MGNTIASEGEDFAESPRVATGEISKSTRKHRSWRKKLADKFKKMKKEDNIPIKVYKEDVEEEPQVKQSVIGIDKRKNYYKNLGIAQRGSREQDRARLAGMRLASNLEALNYERDNNERDYKSFSSVAMTKTKAMPNNNSSDSPTFKPKLVGSKSSNGVGQGIGDSIVENSLHKENSESPHLDVPTKGPLNSNAKDSMAETLAETKLDENELLEEEKLEDGLQMTEQVEATYQTKEAEGFKLDFITKTQAKSDVEMRRKFLSKLTQEKIWLTPSEKPKTHQTCIIFDWDDTLLCTTFLNPTNCGNFDLPLNVKVQLKKLEKAACSILTECIKYGDVYIITNAAEGWVEFSARKYLPKICKILDKVTVMSARA